MSAFEIDPAIANHLEMVKLNARNIETYNLPELPESEAQEISDRITEYERRLASPDLSRAGYDAGTAVVDNDLYRVNGHANGLVTAEHATTQIRQGKPKDGDWGVAGLGQVLHEDTGVSLLAAIGKQTGDANFDPEHPFKDEITRFIHDEWPVVVSGLHGVGSGRVLTLDDDRALDVAIGIGSNPNEQSEVLAESVRAKATELGLKADINPSYVKVVSGRPVRKQDGSLEKIGLKAAGPNTTRSHAQRVAQQLGYDPALVQLELSGALRRLPNELQFDPKTSVMGAYLGYLVSRHLIEEGLKVDAVSG